MRVRVVTTTFLVIFMPSILLYYFYYDSIVSDRNVPQPLPLQSSSSSSSSVPNFRAQSSQIDLATRNQSILSQPVPGASQSDNAINHKYSKLWQSQISNLNTAIFDSHSNVPNADFRQFRDSQFRPQRLPSSEETRDPDPEMERRRQFVKEMMKESWNNYARSSWGHNELRPITHEPKPDTIFGRAKIGLTIVDSLDTLLIMDMNEEFNAARTWVDQNLHFKTTDNEISVFETIIRYVGGLLTCYALTGDEMFLNKSKEVAEALLPAYNTKTGLPNGLVVPSTGKNYHHSWAFGSILSEMGSQQLEYVYLSDMTGDRRFHERALHIRNYLHDIHKPNGLYMTMVDNVNGGWTQTKSSVGALADSFYEYLIKAYVQSNHQDQVAFNMYKEAIDAIERNKLVQVSRTGLVYIGEYVFERIQNKMQHLTCFAGGMYALGAHHIARDLKLDFVPDLRAALNQNSTLRAEYDRVGHHFARGANITYTCRESYHRAATGLGPDSFYFDEHDDATSRNGDYYILRPEVIESYFVLWRLTHNKKYRDYAWEATEALYRYCRTGTGYSGLQNVNQNPPVLDNTQQSFFLAETLKYLYLIFSNDKLISLDEWVFNTEAHPLPICGNNTAYPSPLCTTKFS